MEEREYRIAISNIPLAGKIPAGDPIWGRFNASFENKSIHPFELAVAVYEGHAFTTQHSNGRRATENYLAGQHLALDFDTGDQRSTLRHLIADKFIAKYAALAYTTPSHTVEEPRARVVFFLDTPIMQAKNYTRAAAALLWLFGSADRQCKDAVRFFYGSKGCDLEFIDKVLPLAKVKEIIAEYEATGQSEKRRQDHPRVSGTTDQEEVADALRAINPWHIDYDEWVQILMAIHSQYPGPDGLSLATSWAQGKDGEVEKKWRGFKPGGNGAGAITINTVFGLARAAGWNGLQKAA